MFVLVIGAIAGAYLGVNQYKSGGNGLALSLDSEVVPTPSVDPARQKALELAQQRAADAAVDAAARAKKAAEVAKRQAQEEAASRSEPRTSYPVPKSCQDDYTGNRAIGCALMLEAGFGLAEMPCLERLWARESGWNPKATNPSSGAYGIPQALPGEKMAAYGDDWKTNPVPQIKWGLNYIKNRYETPCQAWGFFQANNWY